MLALAFFGTLARPGVAADRNGMLPLNDSDRPFCAPLAESQSKHLEKICIDNIEVRWRIGSLMGEPVMLFSARWNLQPRLYLRGGTELDPATAAPGITEAFGKTGLVDLKMSASVVAEAKDGTTNVFDASGVTAGVTFDIGVPAKSGGGFSFNVGGSPSWNSVFWGAGGLPACGWARDGMAVMRLNEDAAKNIVKQPYGLGVLRVCDVNFSGTGSVDHALEQACEPSVVARVQPRHCMEKQQAAKAPDDQKGDDQSMEAMLDGVADALDDRKRAEEQRRKADEQRRRLAAQEAERQRQAAERKRQHAAKVSKMVGSSQNLGDVQTQSATLKIRAWDHGQEDGDRVQILLNDHPVIDDWTLTKAGDVHTINLNPGYNAVKIKALNQATGANTAAFTVSDGARKLADKSWDLETGDTAVLVVLRTGAAGSVSANSGTNSGTGAGAGGTGSGQAAEPVLRDTVHIQCASGVSNSIPVVAKTAQCMSAKKNFAQVMACNQVNDFQSAMATCASACGTQDCNDGL